MKHLLIIVLLAMLPSCADQATFVRYGTGSARHLTAAEAVFISIPRDGTYASKVYSGSGLATSQVLLSAFAKRLRQVQTGGAYQSFDEAMQYARDNGFTVLVFPTIIGWEDRATEWSGKPDRVEVKIDIVDVLTGTPVDSATITGKSGLSTFGGDHPQDLLPEPIEEFVASLF